MRSKGRRSNPAAPLALAIGLGFGMVAAAPGEVQNLRFDAAGNLAWDAVTGAAGYHVYQGPVSGLPDYGACLLGSVQGTSADVAAAAGDPTAGEAFFFLATAFDPTGEGTAGFDHASLERFPTTPCVPARRFFPLTPNGPPAADAVSDGEEPRRNASAEIWSSRRETTGVYLHSGEFFLSATDLTIPGRGMDFLFARKYRSQISHDGPLGHGWDFNLNARLAPLGSDVIFHDGSGRREVFQRVDTTHFESPPGLYAVLREQPDGSFRLRFPHGTIMAFHALTDGSNLQGALESVEDRLGRSASDAEGNRASLLYDHQGLLATVVDTLGRSVEFGYDANGRITSITDFGGRAWTYAYDTAGNLISATSPAVTGTPNGNDFPSGKTTTYGYSSGFGDPLLNHNLLAVHPPLETAAGTPAVANAYETSPGSFALDRVISQTIGGTRTGGPAPPAGGTLAYDYTSLDPCSGSPSLETACRRTIVVDRNGNQGVHDVNVDGHVLTVVEQTNREVRPGEPDYATEYRYNADGELRCTILPRGNGVLYSYDVPPSPPMRLDRYREGNLLEVRRVEDATGGGGDCPAGGAATDIVQTYSYEPIYNLRVSATEPRGNDPAYVPQNGGATSPARYTASWTYDHQEGDPALNGINAYAAEHEIDLTGASLGLGDSSGNADGNSNQISGVVVRRDDPTVQLQAGSNQAAIEGDLQQEIVTLHRYDDFGQRIETVDPEGNHHAFEYFPESDPDGDGNSTPPPDDGRTLDTLTGGYLKRRTRDTQTGAGRDNGTDPPPTAIRHDFEYDEVGNRTALIDGRGIKTRWIHNALNQIVELRRGAATADGDGPPGYTDPDLATGRSPDEGGESGLAAPGFRLRFEYDANDNLLVRQFEDRDDDRQAGTCGFGLGGCVEERFAYDLLDDPVLVERDATTTSTLTTKLRYDPNQNRVLVLLPEGNAESMEFDERNLPSSRTRGATTAPAAALMDPADPATFDPRGGTPSTTLYRYDGNGNLDQLTDGRGNTTGNSYDLFDRRTSTTDQVGNTVERFYDPASNVVRLLRQGPVDGSGGPNVALSDVVLLYDEHSRRFRRDDLLFVPVGAAPARTPGLSEGSLVAADGAINTVLEYDRLSRPTFHVADTEATTRLDYDGAGRLVLRTDRGGNSVEYSYDGNHNLVETLETEISSVAGPPDEQFFTTGFYDALNRRTMTVDPIGRTWRFYYDSQDALKLRSDPRGPAGGSIQRRTAGHTGVTVNVNADGNVTEMTHDGAGRRLVTAHVLTASGEGDGTPMPTPDPSQSGDGKVTLRTVWDDNSLVSQRQDDLLNTTSYAYDNLNRRVSVTSDDGTVTSYQHDANDNLVTKTDANGSQFTNTYDAANRRTSSAIDRAGGGAGVAAIEGTTEQTFEYDGLSRLTRATDDNDPGDATDNVTTTWIYDSLGRPIEERTEISDGSPAANTDYSWTAYGLLTQLRYPDSGLAVDYGYDPVSDLLTGIADTSGSNSVAYRYFGLRRPHTVDFGNQVRGTWLNDAGDTDIGYDGARRTVELRYVDPGVGDVLAGLQYGYDGASNVLGLRREHDPVGSDLEGELYRYDSANRLLSFEEGPIAPGASLDSKSTALSGTADDAWSFVLDGASNWLQATRGVGAAAKTFTATPNNLNEYDDEQAGGTRIDDGLTDDVRDDAGTPAADGLNQAHDKQGNLTDRDGAGAGAISFDLRYDALGRLVRVADPSDDLGRYVYDALGRRVKRTTNEAGATEVRRYYYAGSTEIEERDGSGTVVRQTVQPPPDDQFGSNPPDDGIFGSPPPDDTIVGGQPPDDNIFGAIPPDDSIFGGTPPDDGIFGAIPPDDNIFGSTPPDDSVVGGQPPDDQLVLNLTTDAATGYSGRSANVIGGFSSFTGTGPLAGSPLDFRFGGYGWQVRPGGTEYLLSDALGSTIALTEETSPTVLERVTYDAWGAPTFENASNEKLCDDASPQPCSGVPGSAFLSRSRYGNPNLFRGLRHDPETGARTDDPRTDLVGSYLVGSRYLNPNEGRAITRRGPGGWGGSRRLGNAYRMFDGNPLRPARGRDLRCPDDDGGWCSLVAASYRNGGSGAMSLDVTEPGAPSFGHVMLPGPAPSAAIHPPDRVRYRPGATLTVAGPHAARLGRVLFVRMPPEIPGLNPPPPGADFGETEGTGTKKTSTTSISGPIAVPPPDDDDDP